MKNANCSYLCVAEEQNQGPEAQKQDMRIRHHISAALLALFVLATAGCASDIDADEAVKSIDSAMSLGDFKTAQRECDNLLSGKTSLDSVSVEHLCHLAVVMAELAENDQSTTPRKPCCITARHWIATPSPPWNISAHSTPTTTSTYIH